ncbi:MAG: SIR2 family NAD-dependent protein deacylase [Flavobacteriales bacterium]
MIKKIVVFSGAGMSAESGIQTFRDQGGLWERYRIEDVATPEAWNRDPELVTRFYNERRKQIIETSPNEAHQLIQQLELTHDVTVITQNIDDLHERAGSSKVLHLHGNIRLSKSSGPNQEANYYPIDSWELTETDRCPEGYRLRPHVVWFGEPVPMLEEAEKLISSADVVVIIGTSLRVYPAAGLIHYIKESSKTYLIDPNADHLTLPNWIEAVNKSAVKGMKSLYEKLTS